MGLASVGVSCDDLPTYWGPSTVLAGTTISGRLITTPLNLAAGGITIERSCIRPVTASPGLPILGTTNYNTVELRVPSRPSPSATATSTAPGSTRGPPRRRPPSSASTWTNNLIHGFGSGIALMNTGTSLDALIEHNVVTGLVAWGDGASGNHSDAFTIRDFDASQRPGRRVVVRNNRFDCDSVGDDTGALFVQTQSGRIDNLVVERNLLEGGGYQLGLNQTQYPYANVEARDNRFSKHGIWACVRPGGPGLE